MQATFRYSIFDPTRARSEALDDNRDRSRGVKSQFLSESRWYPAMALGVRDILGTGVWEGEYLVATGFSCFDATIGIGWGRLGTRSGFSNPLRVISDKFEERPVQSGGSVGGESRGGSFFRGDASVFGGLSYRFARLPLAFMVEYESDQYDREVRKGTLDRPSAWNLGLAWEPWKGVNLRGSWLRGDTLGFTFSTQVATKPTRPRRKTKQEVPLNINAETGLPEGYDPTSWYDRMLFAAEQSGLYLRAGSLKPNERKASMVIENREYNLTADAVNQVALLSERLMPAEVRSVDILLEDGGVSGPTVNYTLQRPADVSGSRYGSSGSDALKILAPRALSWPTNTTDYDYPSLALGVDLAAKVQLMDPDDPARKQVYAKLTGRLQLSSHSNLWVRYEQNLYNDFTARRPAGSVLPNVRSQVARYLVDGESGIEQLYAEHKKSVSPSVHTRVYAVFKATRCWRRGAVLTLQTTLGSGLNVNAVKQREFERNSVQRL